MERMKIVMMSFFMLLISSVAFAQTQEVSGKVTDNSGEPIIGATVVIMGGAKWQWYSYRY